MCQRLVEGALKLQILKLALLEDMSFFTCFTSCAYTASVMHILAFWLHLLLQTFVLSRCAFEGPSLEQEVLTLDLKADLWHVSLEMCRYSRTHAAKLFSRVFMLLSFTLDSFCSTAESALVSALS